MATSKTVSGEFRTKVYFAHVQEPSQYGNYEVNLAVTPEIEKVLTDLRLDKKIKDGKDKINEGGKYITLRNSVVDLKGFESDMVIVDQNMRRTKELVGNGSECIVYWRSYDTPKYGKVIKLGKMIDWDDENKKKKFATLKVIELVSFAKTSGFEFTEEEDMFPPSEDLKKDTAKVMSFEIEA